MPIEAGTTIASLDKLWPLSGDYVLDGDNHIRLIKSVLKAVFPGENDQGFDRPITATETEINYLEGCTSNVQEQIDGLKTDFQGNLYAPAETVMVFYQSTAPVGWTQKADNNDSMLRVVSGATGGANGGGDSPISFTVPSHYHTTGNHTLTAAQIPAHYHVTALETKTGSTGSSEGAPAKQQNVGDDGNAGGVNYQKSNTVGGNASHNHGNTSSKSAVVFKPRYVNVIMCVKD